MTLVLKTRKPTRPKEVENDASARPSNLFSAFWLPDQAPSAITSHWVTVAVVLGISHYTQSRSTANRVYDSKARRYAEDNIVRTRKSEAEVNNK